jgi:hypothetical protein
MSIAASRPMDFPARFINLQNSYRTSAPDLFCQAQRLLQEGCDASVLHVNIRSGRTLRGAVLRCLLTIYPV